MNSPFNECLMATVLIIGSILLVLIFTLLYKYLTRNFNYWKSKNVFYVKPIPVFGNMLPALTMKTTLGEWLGDLSHKIKKDYFGIFVFDRPVLVVQSPKLIKLVLQKDFEYFQNRSVAHYEHDPIMSNFMFLAKNPRWKAVRSKLTPVFSTGKLKQMFPHILREGNLMVDYISNFDNMPSIESKEICAKFSTNNCTSDNPSPCPPTTLSSFSFPTLALKSLITRFTSSFRMATVLILSTILLVLISTLLPKYFTRNFNHWISKNVFYIKPIPVLGNMLSALTMKTTLGEWLDDLSHKIKKDYFEIFVFDRPVLVVQSPKLY
ncbi:hypothetical protein HUJ05_000848 [Dendroctonus ponderosae]|nr:hypothetical protein HUJ05_000848 [Dendroctonus ponderosae]